MARAYVDEELEDCFKMIDRRNVILLGLATTATITVQGTCQSQAALEIIPREVPLKSR